MRPRLVSVAVKARGGNVRRDAHVVEHAAFFGRESELYGCLHLPTQPVIAGVVICCSLEAEVLSNYRSEVLLARALAHRGVAVQRFHYRGSGHSEGPPSELTLASMVDDAREAINHLVDETSVGTVGFFGARFGAIVAASVGKAVGTAPLVLWEPILDFGRYMREVVRYQQAHETQIGRKAQAIDLGMAMQHDHRYNSLGYDIGEALYLSALGSGLEDALADEPTDILLVQMGRGSELRPPYADPVRRMRARGHRVEIECFTGLPAWWLLRQPPKDIELLVDRSAQWMANTLLEARP